jgi:hypothetical protein
VVGYSPVSFRSALSTSDLWYVCRFCLRWNLCICVAQIGPRIDDISFGWLREVVSKWCFTSSGKEGTALTFLVCSQAMPEKVVPAVSGDQAQFLLLQDRKARPGQCSPKSTATKIFLLMVVLPVLLARYGIGVCDMVGHVNLKPSSQAELGCFTRSKFLPLTNFALQRVNPPYSTPAKRPVRLS